MDDEDEKQTMQGTQEVVVIEYEDLAISFKLFTRAVMHGPRELKCCKCVVFGRRHFHIGEVNMCMEEIS